MNSTSIQDDRASGVADKKFFSVEDFQVFGNRYGIDYHFPRLALDAQRSSLVLQGNIEEMTLSSGICLTHSDVQVLQPYETTSRHSSPLYMLVVLDGSVTLTLQGKVFQVNAGMESSTRLSEQHAMSARHDADTPLRTLSFGVYPDDAWRDSLLASLLREWQCLQSPASIWQVPGFVLSGIEHAQQPAIGALSRKLLMEGLMYQLLGHGLNQCQQMMRCPCLPARGDQNRLERLRAVLEQSPEQDYSLAELAQLAAMSASSLRSKFRQTYGCTVFDYLRDCRLTLARRYLLEGC